MNRTPDTLSEAPDIAGLLRVAVAGHQAGDLDRAEAGYRHVLALAPEHGDALHLLGLIHLHRQDHPAAAALMERAVRRHPDTAFYHNNLGLALMGQDLWDRARASFECALALKPDYPEAWFNLGRVLRSLGRPDRSRACIRRVLELDPRSASAHAQMGELLQDAGRPAAAAESFGRALDLDPEHVTARHNLGLALHDLGRLDAAVACFQALIARSPAAARAHSNLGAVFCDLGRREQARACFQKALSIDPELAPAHNNLGNLLFDDGQMAAAAACYHRAIAIDPGFAAAHNNLGMAFQETGRSDRAAAQFRRALDLRPDYGEACSHLVHQLQKACDWKALIPLEKQLDALTDRALDRGEPVAEQPFVSLVRGTDPARQLAIAQSWAARAVRRTRALAGPFGFQGRRAQTGRLTVGYLSANFRNHPMAHLMAGLFELHDRRGFRIHAYSFGPEDASDYRRRIGRGCDRFVDIRALDHGRAAARIHADRVDILVDLMGHTQGNRMEICALKPAPIQVRYLGLAGTTGADFFDYQITDRTVTPAQQAGAYSERFVYMPHSYQVNDHRQRPSERSWSRAAAGLPADATVLCCFNQSYKIDPVMFGAWMAVLQRSPDTVLWLLQPSAAAQGHLRQSAREAGVGPERLIFAAKLAKPDHLARLALADLGLDTRQVSGAATTSDAIRAGVPVVALRGRQFAANMSSSILTAAGLPELVVESLPDFVQLAAALATDPARRGRLRDRLARCRLTAPLFDTRRFARNLEEGYRQMWQRYANGCPPAPIDVREAADGGRPGPEGT